MTATLVERVPVAEASRLLRKIGSVHPRFTGLALERFTFATEKPGVFYLVTYLFQGLTYAELPDPVYELSGTLAEEDIRTHPDFADLAGKPSDPKNGAVWLDPETGKITEDDDIGVFSEFNAYLDGEGEGERVRNRKAGVQSFASPGLLWTKTYVVTVSPGSDDIDHLGEIDEPDGPAPTIGDRDWLLWDFSYRKRGKVYEVRKTWRLSGREGWDPDIYSASAGA